MDFYLIKDSHSKPPPASLTKSIGKLNYEEFEDLKALGIIEKHLDFYQDLRWNLEVVKLKLEIVYKNESAAIKGLNEFKSILVTAINEKSGLLAYGE